MPRYLVLGRVGVHLDSETPIQIRETRRSELSLRVRDQVRHRRPTASARAAGWRGRRPRPGRRPVCDPCSTAALRRRGPCSGCGRQRRLVAPPGPTAITCADCSDAPAPAGHVCADCGREDKLYARGRCARLQPAGLARPSRPWPLPREINQGQTALVRPARRPAQRIRPGAGPAWFAPRSHPAPRTRPRRPRTRRRPPAPVV